METTLLFISFFYSVLFFFVDFIHAAVLICTKFYLTSQKIQSEILNKICANLRDA